MNSPGAFADLRILATSDVHMHITGWDALRDVVVPGCGMDVLARRIDAARSDAPGMCLLVDNGDALQGTPVGHKCASSANDLAHPWPAILNALHYDAIGLGNHDFDFGVPFLNSIVAQTHAATLCASFASGGVNGVSSTLMLHRKTRCSDGVRRGVAIGVTSVLPPQTALWNHRYVAGRIRFETGVDAARRAVTTLRAQGADIVLMLCHSGLRTAGRDDDDNFAAEIARQVTGIDAMVMGHTHQHFPMPGGPADVHGVPTVMPGYGAETLGVIDLRLAWSEGCWHVAQQAAALHAPLETDTPRGDITLLAAPAIKETNAALDVALTHTDTGFHSYFDMLQSGTSGALVARTMTQRIAAHVADTELSRLPLLASVAPLALGGRTGPGNYAEVPAGVVRARHIAVLARYPNAIWAVKLRGSQVWAWAERSAAYFAATLKRGGHLVNPDTPSFNFDGLHGLQARIDPFQPVMFGPNGRLIDATARRVRALTYQGRPVAPTQDFLVAVTSYRGAGGSGFPGLPCDQGVVRTDIDLLSALCEDVAEASIPAPSTPSVWDFEGSGNARVIIETSPHAHDHLHDIARFDPQVIGVNAAGFLELSVAI